MLVRHETPVSYALPVGDAGVNLNSLLGSRVEMAFDGDVFCVGCGRKTRKSFNQGYCYPCFRSKAACDRCITRPSLCHFHEGTCREPDWGETHCMQTHVVYVANSSGPKVGITRANQVPTRWIDQGAIQAMPVLDVANRYHSGLVEELLKQFMRDRTDWRAMLRDDAERMDLEAFWLDTCAQQDIDPESIRTASGAGSARGAVPNVYEFQYPVLEYPKKIRSIDVGATPKIDGTLLGMKGQYLIFDVGVINVRKYAGYRVAFRVP